MGFYFCYIGVGALTSLQGRIESVEKEKEKGWGVGGWVGGWVGGRESQGQHNSGEVTQVQRNQLLYHAK
jgi:hypothetical protein